MLALHKEPQPGEKLEFTATVNDLRGHVAAAKVTDATPDAAMAREAVVSTSSGCKPSLFHAATKSCTNLRSASPLA